MHNVNHCGHVPCRPPSVTIQGVGDRLGKEGRMRLLCSELEGPEWRHWQIDRRGPLTQIFKYKYKYNNI